MAAMLKVPVSLLFVLAFVAPLAAQDHFSAWFVDSLIKVFPDSPVQKLDRLGPVPTARNGHASLQLPDRANGLATSVLPGFTDYVRDVSLFRSYQRELLSMSSEKPR